MEKIQSVMEGYEILSGIGGVFQIVLLLTRRVKDINILLTMGVIMDAIGLSGMSFSHILKGEPLYAIFDIAGLLFDIAFILYIIYRDEYKTK